VIIKRLKAKCGRVLGARLHSSLHCRALHGEQLHSSPALSRKFPVHLLCFFFGNLKRKKEQKIVVLCLQPLLGTGVADRPGSARVVRGLLRGLCPCNSGGKILMMPSNIRRGLEDVHRLFLGSVTGDENNDVLNTFPSPAAGSGSAARSLLLGLRLCGVREHFSSRRNPRPPGRSRCVPYWAPLEVWNSCTKQNLPRGSTVECQSLALRLSCSSLNLTDLFPGFLSLFLSIRNR